MKTQTLQHARLLFCFHCFYNEKNKAEWTCSCKNAFSSFLLKSNYICVCFWSKTLQIENAEEQFKSNSEAEIWCILNRHCTYYVYLLSGAWWNYKWHIYCSWTHSLMFGVGTWILDVFSLWFIVPHIKSSYSYSEHINTEVFATFLFVLY